MGANSPLTQGETTMDNQSPYAEKRPGSRFLLGIVNNLQTVWSGYCNILGKDLYCYREIYSLCERFPAGIFRQFLQVGSGGSGNGSHHKEKDKKMTYT